MAVLTRSALVLSALLVVPIVVVAEDDPEPKAEKACFRVRDTRSLSAVDGRHVYVRSIRDRHYLLTMENACLGLENSIAVAVSNKFDRVCSNDRAWITYKEFDRTRRCGILTIEEVASREEALALIKARRRVAAEQSKEKTAAPEDSDGR